MLVPKEPTRDMLNAAVDATGAGSGMSWANRSPQTLFEQAYKGMIAAAPARGGFFHFRITNEAVSTRRDRKRPCAPL